MSVSNSVKIIDNRVIITVHEDVQEEKKPSLFDRAKNFAKENPKTTAIGVGVAATGVGLAAAPAIAGAIGATGVLGTTAAGTAIRTLSGVALKNASLAALGGGAKAAGGLGMVGGKAVIAGTVGTVGATGSTVVSKTIDD